MICLDVVFLKFLILEVVRLLDVWVYNFHKV